MNHLSEEIVIAYIDGFLSEEQNKDAKVHLENCEVCREQLEIFTSLKDILSAENIIEAPAGLTNSIMHELEVNQKIMLRKAHSRKVITNYLLIMLSFVVILSGCSILIPEQGNFIPQYVLNSVNSLKILKLPSFNPFYLISIIPMVFLLMTDRLIINRKNHKTRLFMIF
jgi:hypothetical protein